MRPRICLHMIVGDETRVIRRCIESVAPIVDCALIAATIYHGKAAHLASHVIGEYGGHSLLTHHSWVDFATNRQFALENADRLIEGWRGPWFFLTLDADETLEQHGPIPEDVDGLFVKVTQGESGWTYRLLLVRAGLPWRWERPVHERLVLDGRKPKLRIAHGWLVRHHADGARHQDPDRFAKDAASLDEWLLDHPEDHEARRYLARSLQDHYRERAYGSAAPC
jgi:hypothetical protein